MIGDLTECEKVQRAAARDPLALVVGSIGVWVVGSIGVWVVCALGWATALESRGGDHSLVRQAQFDARAVHPIVEKWVVDHPGECPTLERLRADKEIAPGSRLADPWDHRYRITCDELEVAVRSDGPDGRSGTVDDIIADGRP